MIPGRLNALAVDPQAEGRIFVGAAGGGMWRSTDTGSTFIPISTGLPTQEIGAIALDPATQPTTVYAGTGEETAPLICITDADSFVQPILAQAGPHWRPALLTAPPLPAWRLMLRRLRRFCSPELPMRDQPAARSFRPATTQITAYGVRPMAAHRGGITLHQHSADACRGEVHARRMT